MNASCILFTLPTCDFVKDSPGIDSSPLWELCALSSLFLPGFIRTPSVRPDSLPYYCCREIPILSAGLVFYMKRRRTIEKIEVVRLLLGLEAPPMYLAYTYLFPPLFFG